VQRTAAQKMMQEVLEKLSPAEAWSNGVGHRQKQLQDLVMGQNPGTRMVYKYSW
jgi:hypothetical protein